MAKKFELVRRGSSWRMEAVAAAPPQRDYDEDEMLAVEALLKLANGGSPAAVAAAKKPQDQPPKMPKERSHTCNVCDKTFGLYQALGGHKTGHRPMCVSAKAASCCSGLHECSVCHKTFPSGQALGGHMSKHLDGRKSARAASKRRRVTSSDGCPTDHVPALVVRDFDLNEMPAPELFSGEEVVELAMEY